MGTALTLAATIHVWFSEPEDCLSVAARAVELAQRHGFSNFEAMNLVQLGWALTATGGDGSDRVRTGLKLLATSTMSSYPHQLRVAAMEALLRGATREARPLLEEGSAFVESQRRDRPPSPTPSHPRLGRARRRPARQGRRLAASRVRHCLRSRTVVDRIRRGPRAVANSARPTSRRRWRCCARPGPGSSVPQTFPRSSPSRRCCANCSRPGGRATPSPTSRRARASIQA